MSGMTITKTKNYLIHQESVTLDVQDVQVSVKIVIFLHNLLQKSLFSWTNILFFNKHCIASTSSVMNDQ